MVSRGQRLLNVAQISLRRLGTLERRSPVFNDNEWRIRLCALIWRMGQKTICLLGIWPWDNIDIWTLFITLAACKKVVGRRFCVAVWNQAVPGGTSFKKTVTCRSHYTPLAVLKMNDSARKSKHWRGRVMSCMPACMASASILYSPCRYTVLSLQVYCTLLAGIMYSSCRYTVLFPQVYCTLPAGILYSSCRYTVLFLQVYCTLPEDTLYSSCRCTVLFPQVYCTLPADILYSSCRYTVLFPQVYCTLPAGVLYSSRRCTVLFLQVYCTLPAGILYSSCRYTVLFLQVSCTTSAGTMLLLQVVNSFCRYCTPPASR